MKKFGVGVIVVILVGVAWREVSKTEKDFPMKTLSGPVLILKKPDPPAAPKQIAKAPPPPQREHSTHPRMKQVWDLLDEGRTDAAIALLNDMVKENPNDESILVELAMAMLRDPKLAPQAEGLLRKAIAMNPESESAVGGLVEAYYRAKKAGQISGALANLLSQHPKSPTIMAAYGRALAGIGKNEEAIKYLKKAQPNAQDPGVDFSLAELYRREGQYDQALASYERVVTSQQSELEKLRAQGSDTKWLERDIAYNQLNVASVLIAKARYQEAERLLESISRVLPGDASVEAVMRTLKSSGAR